MPKINFLCKIFINKEPMKKYFTYLMAIAIATIVLTGCSKDDDNGNSSNNSNTGSILVHNKTPSSNQRPIRYTRIYNSNFDKTYDRSIGSSYSHKFTDIPEGTYTVKVTYVNATKIQTKTGIKVKKGKTTTVEFQY